MNYIIIFLVFILFYAINNKIGVRENFDGIGKGFAQFFPPKSCCKTKSCYPGMYIGTDFWDKNN